MARAWLVLVVLAWPSTLWAQRYAPDLHFQTLETPHFLIHFHEGTRADAERLAPIAETVHAALTSDGRRPQGGRTHVILAGQDDVPNGWANPFPYNVIELRTIWPRPSVSVGYTDDWLRLVFTHEYQHILHLDRSRGLFAGLRRVFGRAPFVMPNLFLPAWQVEGIATWRESDLGGEGRVRHGMARRVVETAARANAFEPLDRVSGGLVTWPSGEGPYLYGGLFHEYLETTFGPGSAERLADHTAGWPPLFGSVAFRRAFKTSLGRAWEGFRRSLETGVAADEASSAVRVTHHGFQTGSPQWDHARSDVLYYNRLTPEGFPAVMRADLSAATDDRVASRYRGEGLAVGTGLIVFDELEVENNAALQSRLMMVERESTGGIVGSPRRLAAPARAGDPDLSPDGRRVVFVVSTADRRYLATHSVEGAGAPVTLVSEPGVYFSGPRWGRDGRIAVERQQPGRAAEVVFVDSATGRVSPAAPGIGTRQATPAWTPDGRILLLAAADDDGPFNVVAVDAATGRAWQVTSRVSGARAPDISPDGRRLAFVGYTLDGEDIFVMPFEPTTWRERAPGSAAMVGPASPSPSNTAAPPAPTMTVRAYSPSSVFRPRYWTPIVAGDSDALEIGAATSSGDALGYHAWQARVWSRTDAGRLAWSASYSYQRFRPLLFAATSRERDIFDDVREDTDRFTAGVLLPFSRVRQTQQVLAAFDAEHVRLADKTTEVTLDRNAVRFGWAWSSARAFGYSISPEEGATFGLVSEHVAPGFGADGRADAIVSEARYYARAGARHAVLAWRGAAALSTGDRLVRRRFAAGGVGPAGGPFDVGRDAIALIRGLSDGAVVGTRAVVANVDYRVPLWRVERGLGAQPVFLRWVHGALFADAGDAWDRDERVRWKVAAGAELSADLVIGFGWPVTVTTGAAWVRDRAGEVPTGAQAYLRVGRSF